MFINKFDRHDCILALGGGVITDFSGFLASIYMRGIPYISIPTSLMAMVDAAIGGKTAINSKFGKNLIGAFNFPKETFILSEFLNSLDK